jgi:hypothetical protein
MNFSAGAKKNDERQAQPAEQEVHWMFDFVVVQESVFAGRGDLEGVRVMIALADGQRSQRPGRHGGCILRQPVFELVLLVCLKPSGDAYPRINARSAKESGILGLNALTP